MKRILMSDEEAAVHHMMDWQMHLNTAAFVRAHPLLDNADAIEFEHMAGQSERKSLDLLQARFGTPPYVFWDIAEAARLAARQRHILNSVILHKGWMYNDSAGEVGMRNMMGPELYALRERQLWPGLYQK
ncbi:hypothetical protein HPO_17460 [Hyphomonas polymorpha PS728]|uniref:Uncharacterized protein n=1 Tax=Hyphomonas polymorpha PS728 TaxID=1280954 RepID=A0A062VEP1_9PROT|nr:hypothetical protein [Hyphomonas polymorpha]KCZ96959.1 hypothetical protein HPO_17460 [Hyphomonas polymorpha PS728]